MVFKGFEVGLEKYTPGDLASTIAEPLFHYAETRLNLKHGHKP